MMLIKYMGSKARLSRDLAPIINEIIEQRQIDTYVEPFVGGANMIEHIKCENKIGIDNNKYLIAMWNSLQEGWQPPKELSREQYIDIRENIEKYDDELVAIAGFCATYNAKWFGGYAGIVHTKAGTIRNYYDESIRNILKQLPRVQDVNFKHMCYTNIKNIKDALIYCDPPYQGRTGYKSDINYDEYWNWVRELSKDNIILCSEYNAPNDFIRIYEKTLITTLDKNSRKKDTEKLFIHKSRYFDIKDIIENQEWAV